MNEKIFWYFITAIILCIISNIKPYKEDASWFSMIFAIIVIIVLAIIALIVYKLIGGII